MAYDREFLRLTFGGHIASAEQWVCGINFADSRDTPGQPTWPVVGWPLSYAYDQLANAYTASGISTGAKLEWVKLAWINKDGTYHQDPAEYFGTPRGGNVATLASSPQDAFAVTLWSGSSIGKSNYGRFYLPWSGHTVDRATGHVGSTEIASMLDAWHTTLNNITNKLVTDGPLPYFCPMIMSKTGKSKKAYYLRIGDVVDTQRRRRNALKEIYQQVNLP